MDLMIGKIKWILMESEDHMVLSCFSEEKGKTTGWIGYTLSFSERKFEEVNFEKWYPYKFDRRHDFSLVLSHKFSDNLMLD